MGAVAPKANKQVVTSMLSYMYTKYLSYTYVLYYNIQDYGIFIFCNRYIKLKTKR